MPVQHLDGVDLYYEVIGQGQPLVFIHGLGSSSRDWPDQVAFFSDRYRVIVLDLRGHGRSSKPPGPYSIPLMAADTARLVEALGAAPAHIVGISMGGMVAFQLAASRPDLLRSLVIVNSGPEFVVRTWQDRKQVVQRFLVARLFGMRKTGEVLSQRLFPKPEQAELRATFVERWAENDPHAYRAAMQAIVGWSVADRLPDIHCPTLVIASDEDYTPVASKKAYVERMPSAKLVVIDDARHGVPVERPAAFNAALDAFLAGLTSEPEA